MSGAEEFGRGVAEGAVAEIESGEPDWAAVSARAKAAILIGAEERRAEGMPEDELKVWFETAVRAFLKEVAEAGAKGRATRH